METEPVAAARRWSFSSAPLYLLAGLALGDGGIARIPAAVEFVEASASIGVTSLLLALRLEFDTAEFTRSLRRHVPSALLDLVLNVTPGALAGRLLGLQDRDSRARGRHLDSTASTP